MDMNRMTVKLQEALQAHHPSPCAEATKALTSSTFSWRCWSKKRYGGCAV